MLSHLGRFSEIFNRSNLSISRFARLIHKDRRTVSGYLNAFKYEVESSKLELSKDSALDSLDSSSKRPKPRAMRQIDEATRIAICENLRFSPHIWDCDEGEFYALLDGASQPQIRLIDKGYCAGIEYICTHENEGSLIIHPNFPNPAYRDFVVPLIYKQHERDENAQMWRKKRGEKMRDYAFGASEWYSIKSLLEFGFSPIGNFYTKAQKEAMLELVIETFRDNLNKSLYFFDSYSHKIYGLDLFYLSINIKENRAFFKAPMEALIIEITNSEFIKKLHRHYTHSKEAPPHIPPRDAVGVLEILLECIRNNFTLLSTCKEMDKKTRYGELFFKSISPPK